MIDRAPVSDVSLPAAPARIPPSARALLQDVIDYAGSFPPASLPLSEALKLFQRFAQSEWSWMLARMVCPAQRLEDVAHQIDVHIRLSILVGAGESETEFLSTLSQDLGVAGRTLVQNGHSISTDQAEARLPAEMLRTDVATVKRFMDEVVTAFEKESLGEAGVFFEVPLDDNLRQTLPVVAGAVRAVNREREAGAPFGIKMRTGSTDPSDIPSVQHVAQFITACRDADVPFKATAGLHHPVRHDAPDSGVPAHGFLNVFVAALMADVHNLSEEDVEAILEERSRDRFRFDTDSVAWGGLAADVRAIERIRRTRALSFGSCSFDEPIADLISFAYLTSPTS